MARKVRFVREDQEQPLFEEKSNRLRPVSSLMMKNLASLGAVAILATMAMLVFHTDARMDLASKDYRWHADMASANGNQLIRGAKLDSIKTDPGKLVAVINGSEQDPESFRTPENAAPTAPPKIKLTGIKNGVATVEVINAEHLTQRMGTTGADIFMAEVTFTLTEHPDVKAVDFRFEEGDHASPGVYSRKDFLQRWRPVE